MIRAAILATALAAASPVIAQQAQGQTTDPFVATQGLATTPISPGAIILGLTFAVITAAAVSGTD